MAFLAGTMIQGLIILTQPDYVPQQWHGTLLVIAITAFCIQNNDVHGKILLIVVLGILGVAGLMTLLFFWHVWRGPRKEEVSEEDVDDVLAYGWKVKVKNAGGRVQRAFRTISKPMPAGTQEAESEV